MPQIIASPPNKWNKHCHCLLVTAIICVACEQPHDRNALLWAWGAERRLLVWYPGNCLAKLGIFWGTYTESEWLVKSDSKEMDWKYHCMSHLEAKATAYREAWSFVQPPVTTSSAVETQDILVSTMICDCSCDKGPYPASSWKISIFDNNIFKLSYYSTPWLPDGAVLRLHFTSLLQQHLLYKIHVWFRLCIV